MEERTVLGKEDLNELLTLYQSAMKTPMLFYGTSDTATDAWLLVRHKMDALGKKYGFNPVVSSINPETGIVMLKKSGGGE